MDFFMFRFVIEGQAKQYGKYEKYGQSRIHVWVKSQSVEDAKTKAISCVRSHDWIPVQIVSAVQILSEQVRGLDKQESALYDRAARYGIAADFLSWMVE